MSTGKNDQRGVTLMELMVVIIVIGLVAAMAAPRFLDYIPKLKSKSAVKEIVSQLRLARSRAIAEKRLVGVYFNTMDHTYIMFVDSADVASQEYTEVDPLLRQSTFPRDVEMGFITFSNNVVIFSPDGSASSSGQMAFLSPEGDRLYQVSVLAGTGRVRMEEVESAETPN